ncbi:hypothetical protein G6L46_30505 [Agrobacterium rhizogenes]|uniref:hypothetical protein n=1 Tax=Rhizobium rhizogenes TaxID=359 RepID=UPI0015734E02|nr:hypothetical protein [Rhizobium rhizogenes]NTF91501.1 hypothetical protein [Rhizobium rhizogenes]
MISAEGFRALLGLSCAEDREVRIPVVPFPEFGESKDVPNFEIRNDTNFLAKLELLEKSGILEEVASLISTCPDSEAAGQICQRAAANPAHSQRMPMA